MVSRGPVSDSETGGHLTVSPLSRGRRRHRRGGAPKGNTNHLRGGSNAAIVKSAMALALADVQDDGMPWAPLGKASIARLLGVTPDAVRKREQRLARMMAEADGWSLPEAWTLRRLAPLARQRLRVVGALGAGVEVALAYSQTLFMAGRLERFLTILDDVRRLEAAMRGLEPKVLTDLAQSVARKKGKAA